MAVKVCTFLLIVLMPVVWIVQLVVTILKLLTFGLTFMLHALLCSLIWAPIFWLLLGTSYLWLRYWYFRPLLVIPGLLLAIVGHLILMFSPPAAPVDMEDRLLQAGMTDEWPLSWWIWKELLPR